MISLKIFEKGELILKENDWGEKAYAIEKGKVEVFITRNGKDITLHVLGSGETVGEMSIIDDKPYSASVRALEETTVKEIHRDDFMESLDSVSDFVKNILKGLFQRLRNANNLIARYEVALGEEKKETGVIETIPSPDSESTIVLEGITNEAMESLPRTPYKITNFPFRIGRESNDPLANNHLSIKDRAPYHISRHHVSLINDQGKLAILDSGSHLGTIVNNKKMGGRDGGPGPIYFKKGENILTLGDKESLYQFRVTVQE